MITYKYASGYKILHICVGNFYTYAVQAYRWSLFQRKSLFDRSVTVNNQIVSMLNVLLQRTRILEVMLPSGLLQ